MCGLVRSNGCTIARGRNMERFPCVVAGGEMLPDNREAEIAEGIAAGVLNSWKARGAYCHAIRRHGERVGARRWPMRSGNC